MRVRRSPRVSSAPGLPSVQRRRPRDTTSRGSSGAPTCTKCRAPTRTAPSSQASSAWRRERVPRWKRSEPTFQQDLNRDGVIGLNLPQTVLESFGSTSLVQIESNYFLFAVGTSTGPELSYAGAPVTTGEFGAWTPIGAEATATGYDIAWKFGSADMYQVSSADKDGNFITSLFGVASATSPTLEAFEPTFQQDFNGDHVIGLNFPQTVIESFGSTSLVQIGSNYFLFAVGTS